ncbi:nickel-dependent hydrogenase large subunit [Azospirillum sp. RWY-5-1]|uniref:Nickel-dependent hydrogenase large subunit n=1 Tax=Azospirillum oleiclasticum TaxID=2735135 RepID=A0ABX2T4G1_9PROT|nr:nickel-dependent hydrogenase large subunit [Azospirillum oleiclasticum]NYZ11010.1 nickel-dependent hydrogenase large subunit [Azospirillum oleiclasticum]NYZ18172.1 nickel-dependent hydrogenase large subunit [Azospirillum oleiclasticum]
MAQRVVVDPVTRIEGHLRVDCEVDGGKVTKAWASGQMWRGIELILQGKDPRDAWVFAQRICGVCTTVHAITSVRAVENALKLEIPLNAQYIRNLIQGAHGVHDHIVHFYHLSALDFVDITSALKADPAATAKLANSLADWTNNSVQDFAQAQKRLAAFVSTGQLGIFGSGYWGHPAMILPPEANLMAATHYLQALDYQRRMNKVVAILGSKTPHIQNMAVGGVSNPINMDSQSTLTLEKLMYVKQLIDEVGSFIHNVYLPDVAAIGALYADWTAYGRGVVNYLSIPDMPIDTKGTQFALPSGYVDNGDLTNGFTAVKDFHDPYFEKGVKESVKHSWYQGGKGPLHPYDGETIPNYTDWQDEGKYSWIKSPTFYGKRAQVGPLANVLGLYAAGHERTRFWVHAVLDKVSAIAGTKVGVDALHSTIGRHAARAVRCVVLWEEIGNQWTRLMENIAKGDTTTWNKPVFPKGEIRGFGFHEAPRGMLSHWAVIENGKIKNYQAVVPTTWNAGPRDEDDQISAYEAALLDNPVAVADQPLEIIRTLHSFDPCLACAVHLTDTESRNTYQVKVS